MLDKSNGYCAMDYDVPVTRPTKIMKVGYFKIILQNIQKKNYKMFCKVKFLCQILRP